LGSQTWMAENMNIDKDKDDNEIGKCYKDDPANCITFGRLYTWTEAMALPTGCEATPNENSCRYSLPRQGICPEGWHIPSDKEWSTLLDFVGGDLIAGRELKAIVGWFDDGNGWDTYNFSALPGSYYSSTDDDEKSGYWWTASATRTDVNSVSSYNMSYSTSAVNPQQVDKSFSYSVRCVYGEGR